ncbi:hypothetical protein Mal64_16350 [Pseudobythopirellula maris]|uniref:RedB protein n=1 Tax=Pseudobythopirellula maris TaxID=2527991 RepID=A0A5C5ZLS1_9BACT|nr:RedB protein [Pseudobythopirellula maris]TWT88158.1 hypothetical protein Mal64_16350 [Pseudobythopirellula maris]
MADISSDEADRPGRLGVGFLAALSGWFVAVATAFAALAVYSNTPAPRAELPAVFPAERLAFLDDGGRCARLQLIMAVHPRCPCTRASVGELERLVARSAGRLDCTVLAYRPPGGDAAWDDSFTLRSARALPHTRVVPDPGALMARGLSMRTSGAVRLVDERNQLLFAGGVTVSRGHHGDNLGSDAILSILRGGQADRTRSAVFGCPLATSPHEPY